MDTTFNGVTNTHIKEKLVDGLDFSSFSGTTWNFPKHRVGQYKQAFVHVVWSGLTGSLNGSVKLQWSNNPVDFINIPDVSQGLSVAAGSVMLMTEFVADSLNLVVTKGGITGGTLSATLVLKK